MISICPLLSPSPQMALLDFGAIPTGKVNFDLNVHPSAGHKGWRKRGPWGGRGGRQGREVGGVTWEPRGACVCVCVDGEGVSAVPRGAGGGGRAPLYLRGLFAQRGKGWEGRREGNRRGGVGLRRSLSPRRRAEQLQSAGERAVGRALRGAAAESARSGAAAAPGARNARRAGGGQRAAGAALPGHRDLLLACRLALSSRLIYFFPTYTLIRWDF